MRFHVGAVAMMVALSLAGCNDVAPEDDTAIEGKVSEEEFQLKAGKGAITGLLVDDRFRPLHLVDISDARTEFQASGFILLQETGQQVKTDANGQFTFVDLDPGRYTLRVTAEGHEVVPSKVLVEEGLFAEATVVARRVSSEGSVILTEEYSGFTPCAAAWPAPTGVPDGVLFNCNDSSAQSYRPGPEVNYTGIRDITYMVVEARTVNPGQYALEVRENTGNPSGGTEFGQGRTLGGRYVKVVLQHAGIYDEAMNKNAWNNTEPLEMPLFYEGTYEAPGVPGAPAPVADGSTCSPDDTPVVAERCPDLTEEWSRGSGAELAGRSEFIISLFIGDPEFDVDAYQLLDDGST